MSISKREHGTKAVETMLRYGIPLIDINYILRSIPAGNFTNGALERLVDEQMKQAGETVPATGEWQPIDTAPKDNKRPLLLAQFNGDTGELMALDFDGSWHSERESEEIPEVYHYWASAYGSVEEPTHWMYQPNCFKAAPQPEGESK